jgi:hypothetical protein
MDDTRTVAELLSLAAAVNGGVRTSQSDLLGTLQQLL